MPTILLKLKQIDKRELVTVSHLLLRTLAWSYKASASLLSVVLKSHKCLWETEEVQKLRGRLRGEGWLLGISWPLLCFKRKSSWKRSTATEGRVGSPFSGRKCDSLQPEVAFATRQNETGEINTPSCSQERSREEREFSKLLNSSQNNGYHETLDELFLPVSKRDCLGTNIIWLDRKLWVWEKADGFDSVVPSFIRTPDEAVRSMPVLSVARKGCARRRISLLDREWENLWGKGEPRKERGPEQK